MDDSKKITKIVISQEDELTDVVTAILESRNERVVLTFAEETDLLISPINLKVLLETADEYEKLLIAQIIKNPTGLRNANLAGISTIETPSFPEEEVWEKEVENRQKRLNPVKPNIKQEEVNETGREEPTGFQKKIDAAIARSKHREVLPQENEDLLISLDEDLPSTTNSVEPVLPVENDLSKVDFSQKTEDPIKSRRKKGGFNFGLFFSNLSMSIGSFFRKIPVPNKLKRKLPLIGLFLLLIAGFVFFIYINTALLVKVKIYVEAKEVEIEQVFTGDENSKEIDFEEFRIPIKTESVEKSRSTNIRATGKAFRGEKATGKVNITYIKEGCNDEVPALDLPAGHTLSTGGKVYTLNEATSIKCTTLTVADITAIEVGEEYNLASGQLFTFQGYSSNQLLALNNSGAITGGSKEEYTVLSKADVDTAVADLSEIAIEEGETELRDKSGTWELIPDSLLSAVVQDSIKSDVSVGSEAKEVNVSMKTSSSATYFLKDGFDEGIENLLTEKARENNLFETDKDWDLELDEDIDMQISVVKGSSDGISISLVASSFVKPKVVKEDIVDALREMSWEEGNEYLKEMSFSEKKSVVEFFPERFPEAFKRFPKRRGGILVSIEKAS